MEGKKKFEKPELQVVELQHKTHLLQASGQAGVQDYTNHDYYEE